MSTTQVRVKKASSAQPRASQGNARRGEASASQVQASQVDFHQPLEQRLQTRRNYRTLKQDVCGLRDSLVVPSMNSREAINHVLTQSEQLFQSVKQPREAVLDSALLAYTTKLVEEQVERMSSGFRSYDPATFIGAVKHYLNAEGGVEKLAVRAREYSLMTDNVTCMLGPMDVEIKPRKVREARKKDAIEASTRPDDYDELEVDNRNESTKRVEVLHDNLKELNFWKFIYDGTPEKGFGRTVENLFYSSFLVRDGHAGLEVRPPDQPFIVPREAPSEQDYVDHRVSKHQCVVQFDYPMWLALRDKLSNSTYLPAPTAVARDPNRSSSTAEQSSSSSAAAASAATSNGRVSSTISPNSKKRPRTSSQVAASQTQQDDDLVSQIAATPEEEMPKAKRHRVKPDRVRR